MRTMSQMNANYLEHEVCRAKCANMAGAFVKGTMAIAFQALQCAINHISITNRTH